VLDLCPSAYLRLVDTLITLPFDPSTQPPSPPQSHTHTHTHDRRKIPFVTVVTDLGGAHPTWFHKEVDLCFVPSDPVRRIALSMGLKPDQLRQHGLPIR
jgi:hypothetical protein